MDVTITIKPAANDGGHRWLVLATLDEARPGFSRRQFVIETKSHHEALGVASDLLDVSSGHPRKGWLDAQENLSVAVNLATGGCSDRCVANDNSQARSAISIRLQDIGGEE
jgi:hypothetical protein